MISIYRVRQLSLLLLFGRKSLKALSDKQWTIAPSYVSDFPPAIYIKDQLNKVTNVVWSTTFDAQLRYGFIVGTEVDGEFTIDMNDLSRTLELIM